MSKKIIISITLCFAINAGIFSNVFAEEVVISGNGDGSSNEVHTQSTQDVNVEQTNVANVENNVETSANTGENEANNNSGNANIQTGDVNSATEVNNELNSNFAQDNLCCNGEENTYVIEGNGEGSSSSIYVQNGRDITSSQINNANITNNITVNANTGKNEANDNNGNVGIRTGDITSRITLNNEGINLSFQRLTAPNTESATILIKGNGANSQNHISLAIFKSITGSTNNNSNIFNNIFSYLNTGGNIANGNNGNVLIETGDILSIIEINNKVNESFIYADCECEELPNGENPTPTPTLPPSPSPKPGDGGNDGDLPSDGSVGGASSNGGEVLPVTGSYFLYLITIANLIAFFMGWYLRFRSGIAPGIKA